MKDIDIIQALLNGNHLEQEELTRAIQLNKLFTLWIEMRLKVEEWKKEI